MCSIKSWVVGLQSTQSGIIVSRGLKICLEMNILVVSTAEKGAMNGWDQYWCPLYTLHNRPGSTMDN